MEKNSSNVKGYLAIIGGIILELVCGTVFITGNNLVYFASYLQNQKISISTSDLTMIVPFQILGLTCANGVASFLLSHLSPRQVSFLSLCLWTIPLGLLPFLSELYLILLLYGFLYGLFKGLLFIIPLIVGWSHFPEYKGRVAGIILSGFGLGPFLFNPIMTYFINPSNKPAVLQISSENYFEPEVSEKFPSSLYLVMSFIILFNILGILLLFSPASPAVDQNENQRQDNFSKVLKSKVFWQLAFMIFFSVSGDFYIVGNFKVFGKEYIEDDMFLALVGSFSSLIDACSRSLWGYLFDKTSFKIVYSLILTLQFFTYLMLIYLAQSKVVYFFCMMVFFSMTGVHYVLFTAITSRLFGNDGHKVFAVLCYFFALGTFFSNLMHKFFFNYFGYSSLFFIFAGMNGISGILLLLYEEKIENHELAVELIEKNKENL